MSFILVIPIGFIKVYHYFKKKILELTGEKIKKTKDNKIIYILREYVQLGVEG